MRATPLPPGALITSAEWRARGVSSKRLAGPDLTRIFRGLSTPTAAPATVNTMCRVLQQSVVPGAVISHTTAAALMGIAIPWWIDNEIGKLSSAAYLSGTVLTIPSALPAAPRSSGHEVEHMPAHWTERVESGLPLHRNGPSHGPPRASERLELPPRLHCRVEPGRQHTGGPHVVVHRTSARPSFTYGGLELSHPYVTLLELAGILEHDDLVIAIDSLIARQSRIAGAALDGIAAAAESYSGLWGAVALRRALVDARARTDSPGETRTRLLLVRAGFPEPSINLPVPDPHSGQTRYLDMAYPELKIAVEYDGDYHRRSKKQWREDQARKDSLASAGWNIRTLTGQDIKSPARLLSALRRTFHRLGASAPAESNWSGRAEAQLGRSLAPPR
ncbi:MAG: endonuclease domain-containing protein [Brachybacterium sp.]|nr:endonuclease domain-containing protein [Brachybacterium sp.]